MVKRSYAIAVGAPPVAVTRRKRRRGGNSKGVAMRRYSNVRSSGYMGIERKFKDQVVNNTALGITPYTASAVINHSSGAFNAVAQGDGESERDGRKCTFDHIFIRGEIRVKSGISSTLGAQCRIILGIDKQTNGAEVTPTDVLKTDGDSSSSGINSPYNLATSRRFRILYDRTFDVNPSHGILVTSTTQQQGELLKSFRISRRLNLPTNYAGTTANVSTIADNSIFMLAWQNGDGGACDVSYHSRIRFRG